MPLSLGSLYLSFPLIRKRPSIEWIGDSCALLYCLWASVVLSLNGWTCSILKCLVLCLLMVICLLFFSPLRGVRQGCPLSLLLYVLVSAVLAVNIRANPRIEGLTLPGSSSPLSPILQYADDTSLVVVSDASIRTIFEVYAVYEKGSGAKSLVGWLRW